MNTFSNSSSKNEIISLDNEIKNINNEDLSILYSEYKLSGDRDKLNDLFFLLDDLMDDEHKLNIIYKNLVRLKK